MWLGRFEAEGGGQVAPNGLIKLTVSFRPTTPASAVHGMLRVVVWEGGDGRDRDGQLRSSDGMLLCSIDSGPSQHTHVPCLTNTST